LRATSAALDFLFHVQNLLCEIHAGEPATQVVVLYPLGYAGTLIRRQELNLRPPA
jgi:hypothetical protein